MGQGSPYGVDKMAQRRLATIRLNLSRKSPIADARQIDEIGKEKRRREPVYSFNANALQH